MKITSTLQRTSSDFEQRKRLIARKEMDNAYKKNAKFAEASKNPLLAALENLLSGKAEKDLLNQEVEAKKNLNSNLFAQVDAQVEKLTHPEMKVDLRELQITEKEVAGGEELNQTALIRTPEETIQVLENVREAALAPISPSIQDIRIAATATAQIQAMNGASLEETEVENLPPYAGESFDVEVPNLFSSDVKRDVEAPTVFGKELEKELFTRTFNKAKSTYSTHIAMVKNSFLAYNEPQFSMVV